MKLLILTNNPSRPSFRQRIKIHLDALENSGCACSIAQYPSGLQARVKLLKSAGDFDAVFLHKKRLNAIDAMCLRRWCKRLIYDFDDAIMYSDKRPEKRSGKRLRSFKRTVRMADLVIAGNPYLADHARRYCENVHVLATGLNVRDYVCRQGQLPDAGKVRLVWIGSGSTLGYLSQVKPALEEIGRRFDNVVLRIVCDEFFELENMEVERCQWSLETQAKALSECHIGLAPLPDDAFTRGKCGFKILQYAATGIPFVASPIGVNRNLAEDAGTGLLADSNDEWVEKISLLVSDGELRSKLGSAGAEHVRQFDIEPIGQRLCSLVKSVH